MNLIAKMLIESIEHMCTNQGCKKTLSHQDLTKHKEELCEFRMVRCPGRDPECKVELPICTFNNHIQNCKTTTPEEFIYNFTKESLDGDCMNWKPQMIHINKETHMVRVEMEKGKFQFTVLMLGEREKCNKWMVTIENQGNQDVSYCLFGSIQTAPFSLKNSEEASLSVETGRFAEAL